MPLCAHRLCQAFLPQTARASLLQFQSQVYLSASCSFLYHLLVSRSDVCVLGQDDALLEVEVNNCDRVKIPLLGI